MLFIYVFAIQLVGAVLASRFSAAKDEIQGMLVSFIFKIRV
jgi:hypothetical protein